MRFVLALLAGLAAVSFVDAGGYCNQQTVARFQVNDFVPYTSSFQATTFATTSGALLSIQATNSVFVPQSFVGLEVERRIRRPAAIIRPNGTVIIPR